MLGGIDHAPESLWTALIDRLRGGCSAGAAFMVDVKVVMDGNVCCVCTGGVRALAFLASHGRWLFEVFIATGFFLMVLKIRAAQRCDITELMGFRVE